MVLMPPKVDSGFITEQVQVGKGFGWDWLVISVTGLRFHLDELVPSYGKMNM